MNARSDTALLAATRQGDSQALEVLLRRHQDRIFRFGMRMCRDREDAREILQETMLAVTRSAARFRGDASFTSWLFTIARNACAKRRRKRAAEVTSDEGVDALVSSSGAPDREVERRRLQHALDAAIAALEPKYREVLLLRDVEGLSAKEVADATSSTVAAVKSRLHRARLELRARLQPLFGTEPEVARADTCPDVLRALSERSEGDLDPGSCAELERHVASCPRCTARCDALRGVLAACAELPAPPLPRALQESVGAAIREALKG